GAERRPQPRDVAFVAVDRGRVQTGPVPHQLELSSDEAPHHLGHAVLPSGIEERILAVFEQTLVEMPARAGQVLVTLGHERDGMAVAMSYLLEAGLEQRRLIGRLDGVRVANRRLVDPRPGFG